MTDVHDGLAEDDFDTVLSQDIEFTGVLNFEKSFLARGHISGEIVAHGLLLIDEEAVVKANIEADRVVIRGFVTGDVIASARVEITATGRLEGNVTTPEVNFEIGCIFNGKCTMRPVSN